MSELEQLLVRALGTTDAVRLPIRRGSREYSANRAAELPALDSTGVPFAVGGSATSRLSGVRMFADLEERGLARTSKSAGEKLVRVALTEAGDLTARALCGLPTRAAVREFLADLERIEAGCRWAPNAMECAEPGAPFTGRERWVAECAVIGGGWGDDRHRELAGLEIWYCCAAARGWLLAHSVYSAGWAAYALTDRGRAELARPTAPPALELPAHDPAANPLYQRARDAKLRELDTATPDPPGAIGALSLGLFQLGFLPGTDFDDDDDDDKPAKKKPAKPRGKR